MGLFDMFKKQNERVEDIWNDLELFTDETERDVILKKLAINTVIGMIARTIVQSEFRIKKNNKYIKNNMYYMLNVKPNLNQSSAAFWEDVIEKLAYDGECLVIQSDTRDLLIATDFVRNEYAVKQDIFSNVVVKDYEFERKFMRDEVLYLEYGNAELSKIIDGLFYDYGALLKRMFESQLKRNQIRATVDVEGTFRKDEAGNHPLQTFINKAYSAIQKQTVAIIPQQKGFTYKEHSTNTSNSQSTDEIEKVTNSYLVQVGQAVGIPPTLLKGEVSDVEAATRNYMQMCISPILKIISDELNMQFFNKQDYLKGEKIEIRQVKYRDVFDVAVQLDKLISSGAFNGNELRDLLDFEKTDEPIHEEYHITKNYQTARESLEE